ncbi:MAG: UDP-N-acetylmuramate--L-alanine ligase [Verrucomicrobiota bacterium]
MRLLDSNEVKEVLKKKSCRCHLIGVAGSGMSGLAKLLLEQGYAVSGSDLKRNELVDALVKQGMIFFEEHHAKNAEKIDLLIFSSAVTEKNPERAFCSKHNIPQARRADAVAALCFEKKLLAVSGTHGKSTSTAMLAHVLDRMGRKPSYYIGAEAPVLGSNALWSPKGEEMILEADESDGTISAFTPEMALILNIEAEHLDYFKSIDDVLKVFGELADRTRAHVVYCKDDFYANQLLEKKPKAVSYGFSAEATYQIKNVTLKERGSVFSIAKGGKSLAKIELQIPGRHNVSNAAGVFAMGDLLGLSAKEMEKAFASFRGVKRRFDVLFENADYMIVNDYAHHPAEIRATLAAAKRVKRSRVLAAFQPHRYSRTFHLRKDFSEAFGDADRVWITEIYAASEQPIANISGKDLADDLLKKGQEAVFCKDLKRLKADVAMELKHNDLLLVMGAGDVEVIAHQIAQTLKHYQEIVAIAGAESVVRLFEPMKKHTSMRVGGPAEVWFEPKDEKTLSAVLKYCKKQNIPFIVIGRGTNLIVKESGICGVCAHLGGLEFCKVRIQEGKIFAGAGAKLKQVVVEARKARIGGFEFLEGIPGTVGGALRMNAGAMESWMFETVESVRVMDFSGKIREIPANKIEISYRNVALFENHIALGAVLKGVKKSAEEIAQTMKAFSRKRWKNQPAVSSAGCIFRNPKKIPAGKLIDELGLKNTTRGGAKISDVHGNFIVNEGDATADDVLELMRLAQETAKRERGIELTPEVLILGE